MSKDQNEFPNTGENMPHTAHFSEKCLTEIDKRIFTDRGGGLAATIEFWVLPYINCKDFRSEIYINEDIISAEEFFKVARECIIRMADDPNKIRVIGEGPA